MSNIRGILIAAILLMVSLAVFSDVVTATCVDPNTGRIVNDGDSIIIGETKVLLNNSTTGRVSGILKGPSTTIGTVAQDSITCAVDDNYGFDTTKCSSDLVQAVYTIVDGNCTGTDNECRYTLVNPQLNAETEINGEKVTTVARDDTIWLTAVTNMDTITGDGDCHAEFVLINPSGIQLTTIKQSSTPFDYVSLELVNLSSGTMKNVGDINISFYVDSADPIIGALIGTGTHTFYLKTNKSCLNGLDATGGAHQFTVTEKGTTINVDKPKESVGMAVIFSGTTTPMQDVYVIMQSGSPANIEFTSMIGPVKQIFNGTPQLGPSVLVEADEDGSWYAVATFSETGSYTIRASLQETYSTDRRTVTDYSDVTVDIVKGTATITTDKTSYTTGDVVKVSGTATTGDYLLLSIDDIVEDNDITLNSDGTWSYNWYTTSELPGTYCMDFWIYPATIVNDPTANCVVGVTDTSKSSSCIEDKDGRDALRDARTCVYLGETTLDAEISQTTVAEDDIIEVTGEAPGQDAIYIWAYNDKGGAGGECWFGEASVSSLDDTFEEELGRDVTSKTGKHYVYILSKGRDECSNALNGSDACSASEAKNYNIAGCAAFSSKSAAQITAMLDDIVSSAGSDDMFKKLTYEVIRAAINLDDLEDTVIGRDLKVTGTSSGSDGSIVTISVTGPVNFVSKTVAIENHTFEATFDTADKPAGNYTVEADDGKTNPASKTVLLIGTEPAINLTNATSIVSTATAALSIKDVVLSATEINVGENATIAITVENTGNVTENGTVEVTIGEINDTIAVEDVPAGGTKVVYTLAAQDTAGTYNVLVKIGMSERNATLTVTEVVATPTETATSTSTATSTATPEQTPGFEAILAVIGLLCAAMLISYTSRKGKSS